MTDLIPLDAAIKLADDATYETWEYLSEALRAIPAIDPQPDPRDEVIKVLTEALLSIAGESLGEYGCYYTNKMNIKRARAALAAAKAVQQKE